MANSIPASTIIILMDHSKTKPFLIGDLVFIFGVFLAALLVIGLTYFIIGKIK